MTLDYIDYNDPEAAKERREEQKKQQRRPWQEQLPNRQQPRPPASETLIEFMEREKKNGIVHERETYLEQVVYAKRKRRSPE